jgi:hypothetical protein
MGMIYTELYFWKLNLAGENFTVLRYEKIYVVIYCCIIVSHNLTSFKWLKSALSVRYLTVSVGWESGRSYWWDLAIQG